MNNEQFGLGLKITVLVAVVIIIAVVALAVNVLKNRETTASVLEDVVGNNGEAQIENDEEFKMYLEIFASSVLEYDSIATTQLETIFTFIENVFPVETFTNEEQFTCFNKEAVENVAVELLGVATLGKSEEIIYDENSNAYRYALGGDSGKANCMEIISVNKKDNTYVVEYNCAFLEDSEWSMLQENKPIDLQMYKIKATIQKNENYKYSKYYLKDIELLSKDIVEYNK